MSLYEAFGIAAGVLTFAAYPVYINDILKHGARPNRATWWILSLSNALIFVSYYSVGARTTLWVALGYALGNLSIAILSIRYGDTTWDAFDIICLGAALGSALLWWLFDTPLYTLLINIAIDFLGLLPTIYKTYKKPSTESQSAWIMDAAASILALLAVREWSFDIAIYPVYLLLTNCLIAGFTLRKKRRLYKKA
jgi:hypothetical protein